MESKIAIGSDHGGYPLKQHIKANLAGYEFIDVGSDGGASCDYPDFAAAAAEVLRAGRAAFGVLACRTGQGMAMAANRFAFIRAALLYSEDAAAKAREHEDANMAILAADAFSFEQNLAFLRVFLGTPFSNDERHIRRIRKYS
ncbi:MAG: RpiB/LacA/LacB family sugar-phosphate isomerase [Rickettsiales bacterium]|nr:RpiB/LacA/LacB family sugar-phosphate isomerase [Rickettsiales bacterium]